MMNEAHGEKVALITGASKGIGQAICVELAKSGYRIAVNFKSDEKGAINTLEMVRKAGSDGLFIMMPRKDWNAVIDISLSGFYNVTKPILEKMIRLKRGAIVSIASVAGLLATGGRPIIPRPKPD